MARLSLWVILALACVRPPATFGATPPPAPTTWPQTALIEGKSSDRALLSADKKATGMPVMDPRQLQYDVIHYGLDLQVDNTLGWLAGTVQTIFVVKEGPLAEFVVDLRAGMNVSRVNISVPYRDALSWTAVDDRLVISLSRPLETGEPGQIGIQFWGMPQPEGLHGYRVAATGSGAPVVATVSEPWSARSWWPCKDDPTDRALTNVILRVPEGTTGVSNGKLLSTDGQVFQWAESQPIPTYLVSLAVADYVRIEEPYVGPAGPLTLRHHVFPADVDAAREDMSILPEMLDFCGELFGSYPFPGEPFGIAEIPWDQAMEHPGAVSYGDVLITGTHQFDTVLMHELAHMWFGNLISPRDWTHVWLNEGFATYVEALWAEHLYGPTGLSNFMAAHDWGHAYGSDTLLRDPERSDPPYYFRPIAYHKGAWVLHMLRREIGDEAFFAALSHYLARPELRYGTADSDDFRASCEAVTGSDLAWFFEQWLTRRTYPVLRIEWQNNWQEGANEVRFRVRQEQDPEADGSRPPYRFPLDVRMVGAGLDTTVTMFAYRLDQEFVIPLGATVDRIVVDQGNWLLHRMADAAAKTGANVAAAPVRLLPAAPNPFNPRTLFRWEAETRTSDLVEVFDVQGRRLIREDLGSRPAGPREYLWTGRDDAGREAPSGIYLYRITTRGEAAGRAFSRQLHGKVTLAR